MKAYTSKSYSETCFDNDEAKDVCIKIADDFIKVRRLLFKIQDKKDLAWKTYSDKSINNSNTLKYVRYERSNDDAATKDRITSNRSEMMKLYNLYIQTAEDGCIIEWANETWNKMQKDEAKIYELEEQEELARQKSIRDQKNQEEWQAGLDKAARIISSIRHMFDKLVSM